MSTTYFRVLLAVERSRHKGLKIIFLRVWKSRSSPSNKKDPHKSTLPPLPPRIYEKTWRRRWNTGDINFGTDINFRGVACACSFWCVLSPFHIPFVVNFPIRSRVVFHFVVHFFRNNDAAANPLFIDNYLVAVKRTIQSEYIYQYTPKYTKALDFRFPFLPFS